MTMLFIYSLLLGLTLGLATGATIKRASMNAIWKEAYEKGRLAERLKHSDARKDQKAYEEHLLKEIRKLRGDVMWYRDREAARKAREEASEYGIQQTITGT